VGKIKNRKHILLAITFLSGFSAFIYEIVWIRLLSLTFGNTIHATAAVVAVFMAGLGLGGLYFGNKVDKVKDHLRLFSFLEFGIGLSSAIIIILLSVLPAVYKSIYVILRGEDFSMLLVIFLSSVIMFIPTFLMGGILPVLSKAYVRNREKIGVGIGILYALNTAGGIIGVLLTGFLFIALFGHTLTQIFAIVANLFLGIISLLLSSRHTISSKEDKQTQAVYPTTAISKILLLAAGLTGLCGISYEILWVRSLHIFLTNSTYSFTSVLVIFLIGITLGSFLFTKYIDKRKHLFLILSFCRTAIALCVIVTVIFLNRLPVVLFLTEGFLKIPVLRIVLPGLLLSSIIILLPTLLMGISFPLICKIYIKDMQKLGKSIGKIYFLNTTGSVIGSITAGFVAIPLLGVAKGIISIAFINLFLAVLLIICERQLLQKTRFVAVNCCIIIIALFLTLPAVRNSMILPPSLFRTRARSDKILHYKETTAGTVIAIEDRFTGIRACYINNNAVCGTAYDALKAVKMLGHLPFLLNPEAKNALVVGFGIGITASAIAEHDIKHTDCIEICPGVKDVAQFFNRFNKNVVDNPKMKFIGGDGRNYVLLTDMKYDIISCDPTHPILGCNNLYTKEYFQLCKKILNENGVICQYLPLHRLSLNEFKILIRTFSTVFPHSTVWLAHSHGILLATDKKIEIDFQSIKEVLIYLDDDILNDPYSLASSILLDEDGVARFTEGAETNTDNHPYLEFFSTASMNKENWDTNLFELVKCRIEPQYCIENIDNKEKLNRYLKAQRYFLSGLIYKNRGNRKKVIEAFKLASEINPENKEIQIFLQNELHQRHISNFTY